MALDKADDEENRRRTLWYVEDFLRSPTQYKDIYYVRMNDLLPYTSKDIAGNRCVLPW